MTYDRIIIGAGIYGLYAALISARQGRRVLGIGHNAYDLYQLLSPLARVHYGYHYPRSLSTAIKSIDYFDRFVAEFEFAILQDFEQIYAISSAFSWVNDQQFEHFCRHAQIPANPVEVSRFFKSQYIASAYATKEYTFDAKKIAQFLLKELLATGKCDVLFNVKINNIEENSKHKLYNIISDQGSFKTHSLINATYASLNQILMPLGYEPFPIKYELCEVILCKVSESIRKVGLTVMDGAFFSLMPFGHSGLHSLTAVDYTPHQTSKAILPLFSCQSEGVQCSPLSLNNCNACSARPGTAFRSMLALAKKYISESFEIEYVDSLFSMKSCLQSTEVSDARPTIIKQHSECPEFISIFSGKINTIYDMEGVL
ncbi:MAG: amino acid oxidase [Gammaproteobacteria bacterium]|nr:amino acid oxidase [Gammaproteobacteria bacterium]